MTQFDAEHGGLKRVQSAVDANDLVVVTRTHSVSGEQSQTVSKTGVGRGQDSAVAHPTQVLGWIKAEATSRSPVASRAIFVGRTDGLGSIFDDGDVMLGCNFTNSIDLGTLTEQVNRNNRGCLFGDQRRDRFRIDVVRVGANVGEDGNSTQAGDAADRRKKGEARHDDFVARFDIQCHQSQKQRVTSGGATDRVGRLRVGSDFVFQFGHIGTKQETSTVEHFGECIEELVAVRGVVAIDIQQRDAGGAISHGETHP